MWYKLVLRGAADLDYILVEDTHPVRVRCAIDVSLSLHITMSVDEILNLTAGVLVEYLAVMCLLLVIILRSK